MDRLISLKPSNEVLVRIEPGRRCSGELTLRNVMHTMPVAFRLQPLNWSSFAVRPQSGIIPPLGAVAVQIAYLLPLHSPLPDSLPYSPDSFLLHSVVVPGATTPRDLSSAFVDAVPPEWFALTCHGFIYSWSCSAKLQPKKLERYGKFSLAVRACGCYDGIMFVVSGQLSNDLFR